MLSDYLKFISEVFPLSVYNHIGNIYIYMMIHIDSYWVADARPYARHTIGILPTVQFSIYNVHHSTFYSLLCHDSDCCVHLLLRNHRGGEPIVQENRFGFAFCRVTRIFSRPGRSQGLLYKQPRNSLIH